VRTDEVEDLAGEATGLAHFLLFRQGLEGYGHGAFEGVEGGP
jgi:hypothetical protein